MSNKDFWLDQETIMKAKNGDMCARTRICKNFNNLIYKIACEYRNIPMDSVMGLDDLVQEGYLGLFSALDRFDYSQGRDYSKYFEYGIRTAMREALSKYSRTVRIPRYMLERIRKIEKAVEDLREKGEATDSEAIASYIGISEKDVKFALEVFGTQNIISLDSKTVEDDDESSSLLDLIECRTLHDVDESALLERLHKAIENLGTEDRYIIEAVCGFRGKPVSATALGKEFGCSRTAMNRRIDGIWEDLAEAAI